MRRLSFSSPSCSCRAASPLRLPPTRLLTCRPPRPTARSTCASIAGDERPVHSETMMPASESSRSARTDASLSVCCALSSVPSMSNAASLTVRPLGRTSDAVAPAAHIESRDLMRSV